MSLVEASRRLHRGSKNEVCHPESVEGHPLKFVILRPVSSSPGGSRPSLGPLCYLFATSVSLFSRISRIREAQRIQDVNDEAMRTPRKTTLPKRRRTGCFAAKSLSSCARLAARPGVPCPLWVLFATSLLPRFLLGFRGDPRRQRGQSEEAMRRQ